VRRIKRRHTGSLAGSRARKTSKLGVIAVGAIAVVAASCSSTAPTASSKPKASTASAPATLTIAETTAPTTLDPQASPLFANRYAWDLSYQCLLTTSASGKVEPQLAASYTVGDGGLSYTFTLRKGVVFQNGAPFTSTDVVYTFHRLFSTGTAEAKDLFKSVKNVVADGPYKVTFTLSSPNAGFIGNMANPLVFGCAILNAKGNASKASTQMDGTGPWQQVKYVPNDELVLERFTKYWGKKAASPELRVLYIPTAATQVADLEAHKVDLIFPTAAGALELKKASGVHLQEVSSDVTVFLDINNLAPPFNNVYARRAVAAAVDRASLASVAYEGAAEPSGYVPPSYSWAETLNKLPYTFLNGNPGEAKKLLAKAGYPHGLSTTLIYIPNYDPGTNSLVTLLKSQLGAAGINVTLKPLQTAAWVAANNTDQNYTLSWNEQSYYSNPLEYVNVPGYRKGPVPSALARLFTAADAASSTSALESGIRKIEKEEANLVYPTITLLALDSYVAYSNGVSGVHVGPSLSRNFLANVSVGQ